MAFGRSKRKAVVDAPFEELPDEDVALTGTMEMVLERGNVKHLHFDGVELRAPEPEPAPRAAEPDPPAFEAPAPSRVPRSARPLYETDRGNQVLAYDGDGRRQFATTSPHGELPFDPESDVDPLIRNVALEERRVVREEEEAVDFAEVQEAKQEPDPLAHSYREVIPVHARPAAPVHPIVVEEAWEPGTAPARPVLRETVRKPARPKKKAKAVRKVAAKPRAKRKPHSDFPGDDHLVIDIEGIGPIYAKRLQKEGVYTSSRLRFEKAGPLAKRIKAPRKVVKKWQAMAEMMKAKGIGPQYAEVMARVGVKGIDDLKQREPKALAKRVTKYLASLDSSVIGTNVKEGRAKSWVKAASKMRRRPIPVPRKGPPQTETVKGFIEKVVPYGSKAKPAKPKAARKAAKRPARKTSKKAR